jgi:ectoine hydroxylase-related dioxygenase (phytanoyl-CoA dioxygenase family)
VSDLSRHVADMKRDGYTIVPDVLDARGLADFREGVAPHLGRFTGRNPFEGLATERVYTLVGRGAVFETLAADERILALVGAFLRPGFLLSASHAIDIRPGEAAQGMHFDDSFYPFPRPRAALGVSVIGAIDAFTEENGATVAIPGSHLWGEDYRARAREARTVSFTMPAGAAAVFLGTLIHGAGANRGPAPRLAFTNQYCEPWARTQENFFLGIPRDRAARMAPPLQALLGYAIMPPFMGQVSASHPLKTLEPDWVAPVARAD